MRHVLADRVAAEPISLSASLAAGKKVAPDVTQMLMEDHRTVIGWFAWYEQTDDSSTKTVLVKRICDALRAHMAAEEEYFYPAVERGGGESGLVARAREEHEAAKSIMAELEKQPRPDDAAMATLAAEIVKHVAEEESEMFPAARAAGIDLYAVGSVCAARRVEVLLSRRRGGAAILRGGEEEIPKMHVSKSHAQDYFVLGLKNAHAALRQGRVLVDAQVKRLEQYPQLKARLAQHLAEKDAQLQRLETLLAQYGEKPSVLKDTAMAVAASAAGMASAAAADEIVKNSFATLAQAKYEAAGLETLIVVGEAAGEVAALRPLQQSLSESRSLASFIEENLRPTAIRFLQLRTEGQQASH